MSKNLYFCLDKKIGFGTVADIKGTGNLPNNQEKGPFLYLCRLQLVDSKL
jgi:hypothetical protein